MKSLIVLLMMLSFNVITQADTTNNCCDGSCDDTERSTNTEEAKAQAADAKTKAGVSTDSKPEE